MVWWSDFLLNTSQQWLTYPGIRHHQVPPFQSPSALSQVGVWERSVHTHQALWFLWLLPRGAISWQSGSGVHHKQGLGLQVQWDSGKQAVLNWLSNQDFEHRQQTRTIKQSSPDKGIFAYFKSKLSLPESVWSSDGGPPLWDTDQYWHTFTYWETRRLK